jgi:hypothetical protein
MPKNIHVCMCNLGYPHNVTLRFNMLDNINMTTNFTIEVPVKHLKRTVNIVKLASTLCNVQNKDELIKEPILIDTFLKKNGKEDVRTHLIVEKDEYIISIIKFLNNKTTRWGLLIKYTELKDCLPKKLFQFDNNKYNTQSLEQTPFTSQRSE